MGVNELKKSWSGSHSLSAIENGPFHFREIQSFDNLVTNLMFTISRYVCIVHTFRFNIQVCMVGLVELYGPGDASFGALLALRSTVLKLIKKKIDVMNSYVYLTKL